MLICEPAEKEKGGNCQDDFLWMFLDMLCYLQLLNNMYCKLYIFTFNTALLWQKEASDIPSKSELLMFLYITQCALLPGQILCVSTHPAKKYVR